MKDNRFCLICQPNNRTVYWHKNDDGSIWCYCNKCARGYSLHQYCRIADISIVDFLNGTFSFQEAKNNEVQALSWPSSFVPLSDPRAAKGAEYVKSRGLALDGDMYYDIDEEGIVFPYYVDNHFCGAQIRFLEVREKENGDIWKITTLPGTRLGLLFYGWNQARFMGNVKGVVIAEGAFNALSISQAFNTIYGGVANNPWRVVACSGSGATEHQRQAIKELKDQGLKTIVAPDTDDAGKKMWQKFVESEAISHYAFTRIPNKDWNDILKDKGHKEFAKFFLECITEI